MVEIDLIILTA